MTSTFNIAATVLLAMSTSVLQARQDKSTTRTATAESRQTLKVLRFEAAALHKEADEFVATASNSSLSSESHLAALEAMKHDLNLMGGEISSLESQRETISVWEQQAVDKTLPLLKDTAANIENAIKFYNDNEPHLWVGQTYRDYADKIFSDSEQMERTLKNLVKLDRMHGKNSG